MTTYKYQPLSEARSIRLLHLTKKAASPHGFEIALTEAKLDDEPLFKALSYTWGVPYTSEDLDPRVDASAAGESFEVSSADGQVFKATENLFEALKRLAEDVGDGGGSPLWIDALCIDQESTEEKSSQVALMGDIYSSAAQVVVWLGKEDPDATFLWIHDDPRVEALLQAASAPDQQGQVPSPESLRGLDMTSLEEWQQTWRAYHSFYRRQRYFRRAWIIQETALARDITVLCGSHTLDWNRLVVIANLLHVTKISLHWSTLGKGPLGAGLGGLTKGWPVGNEVRQLHMFRTDHVFNGGLPMSTYRTPANYIRGRQDPENVDVVTQAILKCLGALGTKEQKEQAYFLWALRQFGDYHASDKRDHIFAAVAFCGPFFKRAGVPLPVVPDYSMTVQEVYTAVAANLLGSMPLLTVLSYVDQRKKKIQDLPSWVPDFSVPFANNMLIARGFAADSVEAITDEDTGLLRVGAELKPIYDASGATEPEDGDADEQPRARAAGNHLHVLGAAFDTITEVCPASFDTIAELRYTPYLEFILDMPEMYEGTYESREEALWRTLTGNYDNGTSSYPAESRVGFIFRQHVLDNMTISLLDNMSELGKYSFLDDLTESDEGDASWIPSAGEVMSNATTIMFKVFMAIGGSGAPGGGLPGLGTNMETLINTVSQMESEESVLAELEMLPMIGQGMSVPDRRLYLTERGYLGLGPSTTQEGDEVWVLKGARVPFVLRWPETPTSEVERQLVGETYLHGFMDGEMLVEEQCSSLEEAILV